MLIVILHPKVKANEVNEADELSNENTAVGSASIFIRGCDFANHEGLTLLLVWA